MEDNKVAKSMKSFSKTEPSPLKTPHPSCFSFKAQDDSSKQDNAYKNCSHQHPQYYFNNLGVQHIKLEKYSMAVFYLSKALRFLEKNQSGIPNQQFDKGNPNDNISHLSSQKHSEILYNYGIVRINR